MTRLTGSNRQSLFRIALILTAGALISLTAACGSDLGSSASESPAATESGAVHNAGAAEADAGSGDTSPSAGSSASSSSGDAWNRVIASTPACTKVAPLVAEYVKGLESTFDSGSDGISLLCRWSSPAEVRAAEKRNVEVLIERDPTTVWDSDEIERQGYTQLEDPQIEALGGTTYQLEYGDGPNRKVIGSLTGVKVTVVGGKWLHSDVTLDAKTSLNIIHTILLPESR